LVRDSRAPLAVLLGLVAGWAADLAWHLPRLSPRVAVHFGPSGAANGWMTHRQMVLFDAGVMGFAIAAIMGAALLMRVLPTQLVNVPNRDYWFAPERRAQTVVRFLGHMLWLCCLVVALLIAVDHLIFVVNLRPGLPRLTAAEIVAPMAAFGLGLAVWVIRLYRLFPRPQ
jgi:uncharacterized membrane protein